MTLVQCRGQSRVVGKIIGTGVVTTALATTLESSLDPRTTKSFSKEKPGGTIEHLAAHTRVVSRLFSLSCCVTAIQKKTKKRNREHNELKKQIIIRPTYHFNENLAVIYV